MRVTVRELAAVVQGRVIGDAELAITGFSSLNEAGPGDISFLANPKYVPFLAETRAVAVLVNGEHAAPHLVQVVVANPDFAFAAIVAAFGPKASPPPPGIHPTAVIGEGVTLGLGVAIGAHAVISDGVVIGERTVLYPHVYLGAGTKVGADCLIYPQVTVRERCTLGNRVILHPGVVIGSDGFGYATIEGVHQKIPQIGTVDIEDDVEIGANTAIDRARFDRTRIGKGTKIDNLVQIAHNVEIGAGCMIVSQVGIAGSTKLGRYVTLAGQCGVAGHLTIGDQATVTGQSGVSKNVPPRTVVRGNPARDYKSYQASEIAVRRLPGTQDKVKELTARLALLEARLAALEGRPA